MSWLTSVSAGSPSSKGNLIKEESDDGAVCKVTHSSEVCSTLSLKTEDKLPPWGECLPGEMSAPPGQTLDPGVRPDPAGEMYQTQCPYPLCFPEASECRRNPSGITLGLCMEVFFDFCISAKRSTRIHLPSEKAMGCGERKAIQPSIRLQSAL